MRIVLGAEQAESSSRPRRENDLAAAHDLQVGRAQRARPRSLGVWTLRYRAGSPRPPTTECPDFVKGPSQSVSRQPLDTMQRASK
jgi:hypothetical protein